jgi:hypothetical protein
MQKQYGHPTLTRYGAVEQLTKRSLDEILNMSTAIAHQFGLFASFEGL